MSTRQKQKNRGVENSKLYLGFHTKVCIGKINNPVLLKPDNLYSLRVH